MKKTVIIVCILIVGVGIYYWHSQNNSNRESPTAIRKDSSPSGTNTEIPIETVIAEGLDTPWSIVFLPDTTVLLTERSGRVRRIKNNQLETKVVMTISQAQEIGEGGLLGMALHPQFETNNYIYFYYTYNNTGDNTLNRVVRMKYQNNTFSDEEIVLDAIPGASNHNGGRIKFGPDSYLYITTGDAQDPSQAQNKNSLAGKILRVTDEGKPAQGNPFNNRTYSYGHRNPQGLAWDSQGKLWATEHGRSGIQSGLDELNLIEAGNNYGWPAIQGDETAAGMQAPKAHSGSNTWAPGGATYDNNSVYFVGLRGRSLYRAAIEGTEISTVDTFFNGDYGRIRDVTVGPDGMLYIATSNRDGRGIPGLNDDRIIRINPSKISN